MIFESYRHRIAAGAGGALILALVLAGGAGSGQALAQDPPPPPTMSVSELLGSSLALSRLFHSDGASLRRELLFELVEEHPDLAQELLQVPSVKTTPLGRLFDGAEIQLKTFESDGDDHSASLGFSYVYSKDFARHYFATNDANFSGVKFNFSSRGEVAFDRDVNPNDFIDSKFSFNAFASRGGATVVRDEALFDALNELEDQSVAYTNVAELNASPVWRRFRGVVSDHLTDQLYVSAAFNGGLESDQAFTEKQYTYGLKASLIPKGWGDNSVLGKFNVLDYVPALVRRLSGLEPEWKPRGSAFPEFVAGIDQVMPDEDGLRADAGDDGDFIRWRGEISFRTVMAYWLEETVFLEANFRHYQEINADAGVKAAGLDESTYFTAALLLPKNFYVAYTTGTLPLDAEDDQVFEAGFRFKF